MQEKRDIPAFKEKLIPHREHAEKTKPGTLYQFENRDDVVVRPLNWEREVESGHFRVGEIEEISAESYARITKQYFDELAQCGIEIPVQFVVAQRDKKATKEDAQREAFAVVDNIRRMQNPERAEMAGEYIRMRAALLAYYTKKFEANESYLADIWHNGQYLYGEKQTNPDGTRLYLIDIDPYIYQGPQYLHRILLDGIAELKEEGEYFDNPPAYRLVIAAFETLLKRVEEAVEKEKGIKEK